MKVGIENASLGDAQDIARLHIESLRAALLEKLPRSLAQDLFQDQNTKWRTRHWKQWLRKKSTRMIVASYNQNLLGFCAWHRTSNSESNVMHGEVAALYVAPGFWRRGIGSQLCQRVIQDARKAGCGRLGLWVLENNNPALQFYASQGFRAVAQTRVFWEGPRGSLVEQRHRLDLHDFPNQSALENPG